MPYSREPLYLRVNRPTRVNYPSRNQPPYPKAIAQPEKQLPYSREPLYLRVNRPTRVNYPSRNQPPYPKAIAQPEKQLPTQDPTTRRLTHIDLPNKTPVRELMHNLNVQRSRAQHVSWSRGNGTSPTQAHAQSSGGRGFDSHGCPNLNRMTGTSTSIRAIAGSILASIARPVDLFSPICLPLVLRAAAQHIWFRKFPNYSSLDDLHALLPGLLYPIAAERLRPNLRSPLANLGRNHTSRTYPVDLQIRSAQLAIEFAATDRLRAKFKSIVALAAKLAPVHLPFIAASVIGFANAQPITTDEISQKRRGAIKFGYRPWRGVAGKADPARTGHFTAKDLINNHPAGADNVSSLRHLQSRNNSF
ncbi:hypothetical protein J6590_016665 [Homalodisca vitripennis]|nr:hypothetical protein J6590_016665 [Homalodisca vitripennis]